MTVPVNSKISPALDPETYRNIEGYSDETAQFVSSAMSAFTDVYDVLGRLHQAKALADSNPAWTPENRILIVAKEGDRHKDRVLRRFDLASRDLTSGIAHVEVQLKEPLIEKAGLGVVNSEVRAYARGLERGEREAFLSEALKRDDTTTLHAVLGGPSYLSGLSLLDAEHYTRTFHQKKRPDLVRRLDVMRRFQERLDNIGPILHAQFSRAIGAAPGAAANLQRANEQALAALKIEPTA